MGGRWFVLTGTHARTLIHAHVSVTSQKIDHSIDHHIDQLPKLPEEVDALLELVGKMRRVSKNLAKLGMAHMNEARMAEVRVMSIRGITVHVVFPAFPSN